MFTEIELGDEDSEEEAGDDGGDDENDDDNDDEGQDDEEAEDSDEEGIAQLVGDKPLEDDPGKLSACVVALCFLVPFTYHALSFPTHR